MSAPPLHHSLMERGQGVRPTECNFSFTNPEYGKILPDVIGRDRDILTIGL